GQLDGILRRHSRHFAMLYFSDHGLSVSDSANPVHHDGHVQGGYSVPLIITASDITSHQSVSRKISARHFAGIFQWLTGIRTENIPPFNPLTDEDNELIMVFNGDKNVPTDHGQKSKAWQNDGNAGEGYHQAARESYPVY
ncbi:sulfatase-like hydrolase/transferase, partial [Escherichia coli]|uniref:sulfatase-like hydrolase/transferase n=1 Tax=Escherichia coli TaxID=562 RepID=UPI0032D8EFA7